jgi:aminoglycoside phosphotransferase (APT) family kinase protein
MDEAARCWVVEALGAHEVRDIRSLTFGITSNLWLIEVDGTPLVLRRYETDDLIDVLPGVVADEYRALVAARLVLGDVVPEPVAADVTGAQAGRPSLLMSFLPGKAVIHGLDPRRLALPLELLHRSTVPNDLSRYGHWFEIEMVAVPAWTARPGAWSKLTDVVRSREPEAAHVFLHRDFHPGNLLWEGGKLSGIVDWPFSCHGPRGVDVAHTRGNLALVDGVAAAERFLGAYRELVPDYDHHPWFDAADLMSLASGNEEFSGVLAFNAFGSNLDVELLRLRADQWAEAIVRTV